MDITYPIIIAVAKSWFRVGLKVDMAGAENVPATGGAVIACNHNSYLDFIASGYPGERNKRYTRFMAKKEVFDHKVGGPLMRSFHHLAVDRSNGAEAFQVAVDALKSGEVVGVYPEATISRSFEIKEIKTGAVRMAAAAGVPVVPVVHFGFHRVQTKGHKRDLSRGTAVALGKPHHAVGIGDLPAPEPVPSVERQRQVEHDRRAVRHAVPMCGKGAVEQHVARAHTEAAMVARFLIAAAQNQRGIGPRMIMARNRRAGRKAVLGFHSGRIIGLIAGLRETHMAACTPGRHRS